MATNMPNPSQPGQTANIPSQGVAGVTPQSGTLSKPTVIGTAKTLIPKIEKYVSHYERYNGPIGQGGNKTTHTAEVRFDNATIGLAVVKAFSITDKGWLNEAVAWVLGRSLGLAVPTHAVLLVADPTDLDGAADPELAFARRSLAYNPIVMWCASRLDTKPPQYILSKSWESVILRGDYGQKLAAFDGWIGNCDRIADNAPYWVTQGLVAAIDHEKMVFNQDWIASPPKHIDELNLANTRLLDRLSAAQKSGTFKPKLVKTIVAAIKNISDNHGNQLASLRMEIEQKLLVNVDAVARANLMTFLQERTEQGSISKRLEVL